MKILHANKFLYLKGGAERYLLDIAQAQQDAGHDVALWGMQHPKNDAPQRLADEFLVPPIDFDTTGGRLRAAGRVIYSSEARLRAAAAVHAFEPDVVHIHNIYHQLSPSCLPVFRASGARIVMTVHDYKLICPNYSLFTEGAPCERCYKHKYWNAALHKCVKNSVAGGALAAAEMYAHKAWQVYEKNVDVFLAPSQFVADKLIAFGMPEEKIDVLPLFIPDEAFVPAESQPEEQETKTILLVTRFVTLKGIEEALCTFRLLEDRQTANPQPPHWTLQIAGDGPRRPEVEQAIKTLGLESRVQLLGFLGKPALEKAYRDASIVFVATKAWETFGYAVLEGMAAGKPVVAPYLGGLPELLTHAEDGFLYEPGDWEQASELLDTLLGDAAIRAKIGLTARKTAQTYSQKRHLAGLTSFYQATA